MPNLLDIDQLNQILSAVKSNLEISLPLPIEKGGTGVTSVESLREEVTGFGHEIIYTPSVSTASENSRAIVSSKNIFITPNVPELNPDGGAISNNVILMPDGFPLDSASIFGYNVYIGNSIGSNSTTPSFAVCIGNDIANASPAIRRAVCVGKGILNSVNAAVLDSVCIGEGISEYAESADGVCFIGIDIFSKTTSSVDRSVAIGSGVLENLTRASQIVSVGSNIGPASYSSTKPVQLAKSVLIGQNLANNMIDVGGNIYNYLIGHDIASSAIALVDMIAIGNSVFSSVSASIDGLIGIGNDAAKTAANITDTIVIGSRAASSTSKLQDSLIIGTDAQPGTYQTIGTTILGTNAGTCENTHSNNATCVGDHAGFASANMSSSVIIGSYAGASDDPAAGNIERSSVIAGLNASRKAASMQAVIIGDNAGYVGNAYHNQSVIIGSSAGRIYSHTRCVAIGFEALSPTSEAEPTTTRTNSIAIGAQSNVTGDNQCQLGNSSVTTYVYGSVQNRSDRRDKANITDLDYDYKTFISRLKPRNFQWDMREDYLPEPERDEDGNLIEPENPVEMDKIVHDGTHIRSRRHNGFIAQEVKQIMDEMDFDFAGYQDHSVAGGMDVLSLGYEEFIAPMVACIQDLMKENKQLRADNDQLKNDIALIKKALNM